MLQIGKTIYNSVKRGLPQLSNGTTLITKNLKFSLKDPYILEALPDSFNLNTLNIFEGKKLNTVCRVLDDPNYNQIISKYEKFCKNLTKGFDDLELSRLYKKAFPTGKVPTDINIDAMVFLNNLDSKIGGQFDAHGIAKTSITDQLAQLNKLLTQGINKEKKFYTAPLVGPQGFGSCLGTPGGHAYRDGSFIIVSGKGKSLINDGIENVIVNDAYYEIIDDLRSKFPKTNFIKAEDSAEYFKKLANM